MKTIIQAEKLKTFVSAVYQTVDVSAADADLMADSLVQADLWGHQSHGVLRTPWYLERLRTGVMQAATAPEFVVDTHSVAVIDGRDGIGQVLATRGMREAIRRAKAEGVATVAIRNSNHFGTVMYYTRMAAQEGCIAFMSSNGGPAMAPWGGYRDKIVGTNPWSIAAPAGSHPPMMLDIANTGVARGKIYLAKNRHETIPAGWALNKHGVPTTDPAEAIEGIILPMAGHKGYAIGVMMDVLSGVLSGSKFLSGVNGPYRYHSPSGAGHFISVYHIDTFMPLAMFNQRMEEYIAELKRVPTAQGVDDIFYPGEMEERRARINAAQGLELAEDTLVDLRRVAEETGLSPLLPW